MVKRERPLSPHLQVYRPQITSVLSILNRITGMALVGGALLLANWILSASYGPEMFDLAQSLLGSWFGRLVLFGMTFSLYFHLANGIRHISWDIGYGFELSTLNKSGIVVVLFAIVMTVFTFYLAYASAGVL